VIALADVPVGGGVVIAAEMIVVTQPAAGDVKAFGSTCTHQGCQVNDVSDGEIKCPCHGSRYSIEDGSVVSGPAPEPLPAVGVAVEGDQVVLT
jgi:Rieske Fe-S protein